MQEIYGSILVAPIVMELKPFKGAFDLLKNRGLDWTTFFVLRLIQKLLMVLDKMDSKRHDKNKNFCSPLNHRITFCPWYNYKKYKKYSFYFRI
jgi:hypothetical protein